MSSRKKLKPKILVVDDELDNLDLLYRTFHKDYKVLQAKSGLEALEILETSGEVAVIISDQRMPRMNGTEFLSLTAKQYPDTIRILLTGFTDVEDLVEAINSGKVFKYLTKPWNAQELKGLVKQAVETHNVLKSRTEELRRALQQESLLYAVTNTIRSAPNYRQMLQRIVETIGQMFEVSLAICCPFQDSYRGDEWFIYQNKEDNSQELTNTDSTDIPEEILAHILWETTDVEIISDVQNDERFQGESIELQKRRQAYQAGNIRSSLIVPLFSRLDLIAVLALHQCEEIRNWQDHEVQLLITVADQAALALSQARAYEQLSSIAQREALVNTITTAIRSSLNPQDIFAAITQELGKALDVDGCVLSLWTETDEYVQCVGLYDAQMQPSISTTNEASTVLGNSAGRAEIPNEDRFSTTIELPQSFAPIRNNPILMELLKTKKTIAVSDLNKNPEFNESELPLRSNARALMVVPLTVDGKIIGSISLRHNCDRHEWQAYEIDLAEAVASQAAIAVQQSSLYQTTRQQAERLIEADRLKTEFFQNISHEFRTPLTLTIGLLEEAVNSKRDLPLEQGAIALRNSRRLLRLVNQLLDLQRIDAGRMQPSFQPCNLVAFCRNIVESFASYCEKKQLHLVTQFSKNCPLVYLDIERFDKVIYNLLSNAMKFTPAGGTITISVEPVGENCLLKVQDSGIGIRQEQIPFLFERFRQAEGSANRSYEGSGIGLALVKELVELHNGQVNVESVYGQGATFEVWLQTGNTHLPAERVVEKTAEFNASKLAVEFADVEAELEEAEELQAVDRAENIAQVNANDLAVGGIRESPPTILVVDDNPDLRSYVSRIMRKYNFNVLSGRNGAEGFEIAQTHHPHLIITDLMMPIVSGLDLIKMIREEKDLRGIPIILLTAKADEDTRIEGVERGADAYLSKPFNDRELLAEVNNLLALKENERKVQELNSYLTESVLRRFLPPEMVQRAAQGDLALDLRPEPKLVTVLFSDIVGFTQMSNILQARRIAELLNEYLAEMTTAIFANGGTVDKFVGDAVMAIYGSPEELTPDEQVQRAVASARAMLKALDRLNERWQNLGLIGQSGASPVRFRCGIHQGNAVVGMFGGAERSDYTAIGPSVNIAARLQEAAEPNTILVSQIVANYLDSREVKKYGYLKLKGIDEEVLGFVVGRDSIRGVGE
ncbi:MAG: response regulator [Okeania sp. SIO3B3]|nr:response regulator [Okeania sp. SIO3B3]